MAALTEVIHPRHGRGQLIRMESYARQPTAVVKYPWGRTRCLLSELRFVGTGEAVDLQSHTPEPVVPAVDDAQRSPSRAPQPSVARMAINALRLGQITDDHVQSLSVSTGELQSRFEHLIKDAVARKARVVLVEGPWGSGKTHALALLSWLAKEHRLAVASAVLDGFGRSLTVPMALFDPMLTSLRYPDSPMVQGVADSLHRLCSEGRVADLRPVGARTLWQVLSCIPKEALQDLSIWQEIEGYLSCTISKTAAQGAIRLLLGVHVALPTIAPRYVDERPEAFVRMLGEWAQFASLTGARGLLVILDELDADYACTVIGRQSAAVRRRSLLSALAKMHDAAIPLILALGSAPSGPSVPLDDDPIRQIQAVMEGRITHIRVPEIDKLDLRTLYRNLTELYRSCYTDGLPRATWDGYDTGFKIIYERYSRSPDPTPRRFVRWVLEFLDTTSVSTTALDPGKMSLHD